MAKSYIVIQLLANSLIKCLNVCKFAFCNLGHHFNLVLNFQRNIQNNLKHQAPVQSIACYSLNLP